MEISYQVTTPVKIKNANGTSQRKCACGSWLDHWKKFSQKNPGVCSVSGCGKIATLGAHVVRPLAKNEAYKTTPYIVPMCSHHNSQQDQEFDSIAPRTFVWANVAETCG